SPRPRSSAPSRGRRRPGSVQAGPGRAAGPAVVPGWWWGAGSWSVLPQWVRRADPAVRAGPTGRSRGAGRSVGPAARTGPSAEPVGGCSEEAELLFRVADQQVLRLLVVVEHHQVVLPPDARGLVPAERGVRRVAVIVVHPHATGLDGAAGAVDGVLLPRPHTGAQPVQGVVRDRDRLVVAVEPRQREHRTEDLLLEDPHRVVALEERGGDVVAAGEVAAEIGALAAGEPLRALLRAGVEAGGVRAQLVAAGLRGARRVGVRRVALRRGLHAGDAAGDEGVGHRGLHERPRGRGAHLALVQRKHREALERLVVVVVLGRGD